jgi:YD repeat-containing protein
MATIGWASTNHTTIIPKQYPATTNNMKKFSAAAVLAASVLITATARPQANDNFAKMVDVLPPAPNAAAMARYGGLAVNKNAGTPNVSIPLYALKGKKLAAELRLSYASNGIRVDEIASRAGMGFVLQGGGVITRTVRGWADETHTRRLPWAPIDLNWGTFNYMKALADATFYGGDDGEPDLFTYSYPGASGSFVLDHNMSVVQVPFKNQKIVYNFNGTDWHFKITNDQGITYYYGGPGAVEKTKRTSDCAKAHVAFTPTAWYLKKITHPNGETITFYYEPHTYSYDEGVSETMRWDAPGAQIEIQNCFGSNAGGGTGAPAGSGVVCTNRSTTEGVLLTAIANGTAKLQIEYMGRADCEDKLISGVKLRELPSDRLIGYFNLQYSTVTAAGGYTGASTPGAGLTPYLINLQEFTADGSQSRSHFFMYNDPAARPPRLSYAQDHWGYFNGRNNATLVPTPSDPQNRPRFPFATGNREPDGGAAAKGLLCKVVYPTGGMDSILYEPNTRWAPVERSVPHQYVCSVTAVDNSQEKTNVHSFALGNNAFPAVQLYINCANTAGLTNFTHHHVGTVEIVNTATGLTVASYALAPNHDTSVVAYLVPNNTYQCRIKAQGVGIQTTAHLGYGKQLPLQMQNVPVGGLRVQTVLTASPGQRPLIKQYHYGEMATPTQSSAAEVQWPEYMKVYKQRHHCVSGVPNNYQLGWRYTSHVAMHANSLTGLANFGGAPVSYASVIESEGEGFANGAVQTRFGTDPDRPGQLLWGTAFLNAPKSARSNVFNGLTMAETLFKNGGNGNLLPLKKTSYSYTLNPSLAKSVWGYTVNQDYPLTVGYDTSGTLGGNSNISQADLLENLTRATESYSMMKYEYPSYWITNDSITETVYDQNGEHPIATTTRQYFENTRHLQLTRKETTNSEGKLLSSTYQYPDDFAGNMVYDALLAKNMTTPVITSTVTQDGQPVSGTSVQYGMVGNNNIEPVLLQKSTLGSALVTEGSLDQYDAEGNILQYTGADGITHAIVWGYRGQYPVAKITGATYAQAVAQLPVSVADLQNFDGTALQTALQAIRTGLPAAQVTSYTYQPFAGPSSVTGPNGRTTTYTYDGFNRLVTVTDPDGNTVKKAEYQFVGAAPGPMPLYFNGQQQQLFYNNQCSNGYNGEGVPYTVAAKKYWSVISQADADAKALADLQANGQQHANRTGTCFNNGPCSGPAKRMVNCLCETGIKVYTASVNNGNGTFTCTYHYRWSDGFNGPDITETIASTEGCNAPVGGM